MVEGERKVSQDVPFFNGENCHVCARKMKTINDLWDLEKNGFTHTIDPVLFVALTNNQKTQLKETRRKDAKTMSFMEANLTRALFSRIEASSYSKERCDILKIAFKGTDQVRVVNLQML